VSEIGIVEVIAWLVLLYITSIVALLVQQMTSQEQFLWNN
jgi:hypothetical protein